MATRFQRLCILFAFGPLWIILLASASVLSAADTKAAGFECRWTEGPISIDGKAEEQDWKGAQAITNFSMPWLGKGPKQAFSATRARLLWDREYLYFFAEMDDADLSASPTRPEKSTWEEDGFEIFLKPSRNQGGYYQLQVNAANARRYNYLPPRGGDGVPQIATEGPFQIETAVVLHGTLNKAEDKDQGWAVEGRIPWRDFMHTGGRPGVNEVWTFALCRCDYSLGVDAPVLSSVAPFKRMDFHRFEDYAGLRFVGPSEKSVKPYGLDHRILWTNSHVIGSPTPPFAYRTASAFPNLKVQLPVAIASEPGSNRLIFIEHTAPWSGYGKVRRFKNEPGASEAETLLELDDIIYGITFHPKFQENGYFYLGCNGPWNKDGKKNACCALHARSAAALCSRSQIQAGHH